MFIEITDEWFRHHDSSAEKILLFLKNEQYTTWAEIDNKLINTVDTVFISKFLKLNQFNILAK